MNRSTTSSIIAATLVVFALAQNMTAQTTAFNYQGSLKDGGSAASGPFQMQFKLFDSLGGTGQIGSTITDVPVTVSQGVFGVKLDFGSIALNGANRWLEIAVRRNSSESYTTLSPREQIASSPYSVRTLSAATADVALDSNKLGGVDASQYVTTTSGGNSFIKNSTAPQTADFNISGNGIVGGTVGIGTTPEAGYKLDVNGAGTFRTGNGRINFGSPSAETGTAIISDFGNRADIRFDGGSLKLVAGQGVSAPPSTNGIAINTAGTVGIGTTTPFLIHGDSGTLVSISGSSNPGLALTNTSGKQFFMYSAGGGGSFRVFDATSNADRLTLDSTGNLGIGTTSPAHRLSLIGGPSWTTSVWGGALELGNASAIGWRANAAGNRFGIGQTTGGLVFFATLSDPGNTASPANAVMQITDTGNITQPINNNGLVKAMLYVAGGNAQIIRCFNSVTNSTTGGCGFTTSFDSIFAGNYTLTFPFQVNNRFISVSVLGPSDGSANFGISFFPAPGGNPNRLYVKTYIAGGSNNGAASDFMVIVY